MSEVLEPKTTFKTVKVPPEISLDSTDLPEIKDYDVGDTYEAVIKCKMVSKHAPSDRETQLGYGDAPKGVIRGRFQILDIRPVDKGSTNNKAYGKLRAINKRLS